MAAKDLNSARRLHYASGSYLIEPDLIAIDTSSKVCIDSLKELLNADDGAQIVVKDFVFHAKAANAGLVHVRGEDHVEQSDLVILQMNHLLQWCSKLAQGVLFVELVLK